LIVLRLPRLIAVVIGLGQLTLALLVEGATAPTTAHILDVRHREDEVVVESVDVGIGLLDDLPLTVQDRLVAELLLKLLLGVAVEGVAVVEEPRLPDVRLLFVTASHAQKHTAKRSALCDGRCLKLLEAMGRSLLEGKQDAALWNPLSGLLVGISGEVECREVEDVAGATTELLTRGAVRHLLDALLVVVPLPVTALILMLVNGEAVTEFRVKDNEVLAFADGAPETEDVADPRFALLIAILCLLVFHVELREDGISALREWVVSRGRRTRCW
jgi:hypothetical protein